MTLTRMPVFSGRKIAGRSVAVSLAPPPAVAGTQSLGQPVRLLDYEVDEAEADTFDVVLGVPDLNYSQFVFGGPITDLVGILSWGQDQAHVSGSGVAGVAMPPRQVEFDWLHGAVIAVGGSSIQLDVRWDNYSAGLPPADINVAAFVVPHGSSHSFNAQRTHHNFLGLAPGANEAFYPPAFSRSFVLHTNGSAWQVQQVSNLFTISLATLPGGNPSPVYGMVGGCKQIVITNIGAVGGPLLGCFHTVHQLAL